MNQDIHYNGYSANPSDYECQDGELAMSLNLINEDGGIGSIAKPAPQYNIGIGRKLFIHRIGTVCNYISYTPQARTIDWIGTERDGKFEIAKAITLPSDMGAIISIAAVGYILIISTSLNLYYLRYNAKKNSYTFLGSKIPDIFLELALKLNFTISDTQDKSFEVSTSGGGNSGGTTGDDYWQTALAVSYDVSSANGLLKREWVYFEQFRDSHVSTQFTPFDNAFKILANVEYKFKWDVIAGCHNGMTIGIWGNRNGSTEREMLFWTANEHSTANSIEVTKTFADEWTNVCYIIDFRYNDTSSANCGTRGNITWYKGIDNSGSGSDKVSTFIDYTSDTHTALMGAINKFIKEQVTDKSRFMYPFFARYAVKLFDGSYSNISEPILLIPNSGYVPAVSFSKHYSLGTRLILTSFAADIRYKVRGAIPEDWEDLITGIDVFVSPPIWSYNQGQSYDGSTNYFKFKSSVDTKGYGRAYFEEVACDGDSYGRLELKDYITRYATNIITNNFIQVAPRTDEEIRKDIVSVANFYKICSLGITELKEAVADFVNIDLEKGMLTSLVARETLKDDTLQYIGFKNAGLKEYNNRLHVYHSSIVLRSPSHPKDCFNHITDSVDNKISTYVYLATEDGTKILHKADDGATNGSWFFYPDGRAYKAIFVLEDNTGNMLGISEVDLKRHDFLNGAYWYGGNNCNALTFKEGVARPMIDLGANSINAPSTIYVSEANCPFIFKAISAVSIGAQEVVAVSSAAKALSQGQFGQFPLYAFTDEGVWAMEVSGTGTYSAKQPITRDVCINPEGITQIDSAVLFPTNRGIMLISGSQTECISDVLNTATPFDITTLPRMNELHAMLGDGHELDNCIPTVPFLTFLKDCRMIYDYVHQRIIVYNSTGGPDGKGYTYAYVYSLKSKLWGMMYSDIKSNLNSYPNALAVTKEGKLVDFSLDTDKDGKILPTQPGLLLTRPLKLGGADVMKTIDTVIQRGNFQRGHVQTVLYGSRNLKDWHLVWSSKDHYLRGFRGTPYKYFRIALLCNLDPGESIFGASVNFNPRLGNQLR